MTVSIIVAVKGDNPNLRECVEKCLQLEYPRFEILILADRDIGFNYPKTIVIPTGDAAPPVKRDMALDKARGEILALLDDDAYPVKEWLSEALKHFKNPEIAAVCGPAITPESDSLRQKASGLVYSSWLMSGSNNCRYLAKPQRYVDDFPSCNFLLRKSVMREAGGFNTKFWPGEDTFLCLKIIRDLKKKIIYDPKVLVYHHRRGLFTGHLKQIANYGLHRGYFVKRFPHNSLKPGYFLPSVLAAALALGLILPFINPVFSLLYCSFVFTYLLIVFISSAPKDLPRDLCLTWFVFWGIILSHITYGIYFIKGLLAARLSEE